MKGWIDDGTRRPWVRVIIVNFNGGSCLQDCVNALARQSKPNFEAVIVDNGSSDRSMLDLSVPDARFQIHRADRNLGFAAATNLGVQGCVAPWIATLNPDAFPRADWLAELHAATERYPWARAFGSTQLDARAPHQVDAFGDVYSAWGIAWPGLNGRPLSDLPDGDREVFSPCAAAALYDRGAFEAAGGLDESFFCYQEDVDLGFRLRLRGEHCIQVRRAEVLHLGSEITGRFSAFKTFHSSRNRIWLLLKSVPWPLIWLMLLMHIPATLFLVLRGLRFGIATSVIRGALAGIIGIPQALRSRRIVQQQRRASNLDIARAMSWTPFGPLRRSPHFVRNSKLRLDVS
jgi:N-acetylglucosaminyl-diphospho-decaprenol L-rhamnosyltransferase